MKRTVLSMMLALILTLTLLSPAVSAAGAAASGTGWNVEWALGSDGTLTITGDGRMTDSGSSFDPPWSGYADQIRRVVITDGVQSIERYAFTSCPALTDLYIPDSVTAIGPGAFADCGSLTSILIPRSVEEIGAAAFSGCGALTAITVAQGNTCYADLDGALTDSTGTRLIQVPGGICGTYTVPETVTVIETGAFLGCHLLIGVVFPDHITELPEDVLRDLTGLTTVKLPAELTRIPWGAFSGCTALRSVTLPYSLEIIADGAFENCTSLRSLVLPEGLIAVGDFAFAGCGPLTICYPEGSSFLLPELRADIGPGVTWNPFVPGSCACDSDLRALAQGIAFLYRTCQ